MTLPWPGCGKFVSCVETMRALSLADKTMERQTRWCSRPGTCRTSVNTRTQWGSVRGSLYFSTHTHVLYVSPVWGGNILSPEKKNKYMKNTVTTTITTSHQSWCPWDVNGDGTEGVNQSKIDKDTIIPIFWSLLHLHAHISTSHSFKQIHPSTTIMLWCANNSVTETNSHLCQYHRWHLVQWRRELPRPLSLHQHFEAPWKGGRGNQTLQHSCQTRQKMDRPGCQLCGNGKIKAYISYSCIPAVFLWDIFTLALVQYHFSSSDFIALITVLGPTEAIIMYFDSAYLVQLEEKLQTLKKSFTT